MGYLTGFDVMGDVFVIGVDWCVDSDDIDDSLVVW